MDVHRKRWKMDNNKCIVHWVYCLDWWLTIADTFKTVVKNCNDLYKAFVMPSMAKVASSKRMEAVCQCRKQHFTSCPLFPDRIAICSSRRTKEFSPCQWHFKRWCQVCHPALSTEWCCNFVWTTTCSHSPNWAQLQSIRNQRGCSSG